MISSFLILTGCGSYSENSSAVTVQSDSSVFSVTSEQPEVMTAEQQEEKKADGMQIAVGDTQFRVSWESSDTVTALTEMLPLTLDMSELNGNEKYDYLDTSLPSSPENVGHISKGDIMLYGDNCLVVFYESFDTPYSYTKIGHISDTSGLADALGKGVVTVTFEMNVSQDTEYTVQDVRNLNDFLLAKPTEDLRGKPYDLDNDGVWSVFDLCLLKRKILEQRNMTTEFDYEKAHGRTSAQVILRWHLQAGYVTIPGSQNPDHILENYSIFDFELTDAEMQRMAELHTGQRYENW